MKGSKKGAFSEDKQKLVEAILRDVGIDLPPPPRIPRKDPSVPCLLALSQERSWRAWRSACGEPSNEVLMLRLSGPLNSPALIQALGDLVGRHEILRTRFEETDGQALQQVCARGDLEVPVAHLSDVSHTLQEADWKRISAQQAAVAFNLEAAPPVRAGLVGLNPNESLLILTLHEIICDGPSKGILLGDLGRAYESSVLGAPTDLDDLTIQFCDFAMWQRRRLEAGQFDRDIQFWKRKLEGRLRLGLSGEPVESATGGSRLGSCDVRLSNVASEQVKQVSRSHGLTAYLILLAGWQVLLNRYTGHEALVGTLVGNRDRPELQTLIGPVSNTLLIAVDLEGNPPFSEVIRRVRDTAIEAFERQVPYELLLGEVAGMAGEGADRVAHAMFIMEEGIPEGLEFAGLKVAAERLETGRPRGDLAMIMRHSGDGFEGRIEYTTRLFDAERVVRMAAGYERLMEVILGDLDCRIRNLPPILE